MKRAEVVEQQNQGHVARQKQQIAIIDADLAGAKAELAGVHRQMLEAPDSDSEELKRHAEALDNEIEGYERARKRHERLLAEALQLDTDAAKKASLARMDDLEANIAQRLARQMELAIKIVATVESLAPLLGEYDVLATDNKADAWACIKAACGGDYKLATRHEHILREASGVAATSGIINALWASGLGRTGVYLGPWIEITSCGAARPLEDEMDNAARRVLVRLRELIDHRKGEVLGTAKASKTPTQTDRFIPGGKQLEEAKESFKE
jgi:hypothetical protein